MRQRAAALFILFTVCWGTALTPRLSRAQTPTPFVTKLAETLEFTGFIQPRWEYTNQTNALPSNSFRLRRAEIGIKPSLTARLKSTVVADFIPTALSIKDVYFDFLVSPKGFFTIRMGQWKKPFSREELRSSSAILMVDKGRMDSALGPSGLFVLDRDMGVAVLGDFYEKRVPFEYQFGIFNGNGANLNADTDSRKAYVGRIEFVPVAGLAIGANFSINDLGVNRASGVADTLGYPGNQDRFKAKAYGVDAKIQKLGFILEAEFRNADNWRGGAIGGRAAANILGRTLINRGITTRGVCVTTVYKAPTHNPSLPYVEPGFRVETYDPNTKVANDRSVFFTACLGLYVHEACRFQVNAVMERPQDSARQKITTFAAQWTVRY
jgi:hypothetical protein